MGEKIEKIKWSCCFRSFICSPFDGIGPIGILVVVFSFAFFVDGKKPILNILLIALAINECNEYCCGACTESGNDIFPVTDTVVRAEKYKRIANSILKLS